MLHLSFTPFPNLTTERLLLRQLTLQDDQEIFLLRSDDSVNEFLDRPKATSIEDAQKFIEKINNNISNDVAIFWAITLKNDSKLMGTIMFWNISVEDHKAEIGYELLPAYQGKGYMQEALSRVLDFGFSTLKLHIIEAWLVAENLKSIKLLEKYHFKRDFDAEKKNLSAEDNKSSVIYTLTS
jgi:ribosomal-protein-alanine N-acetyltransferase